MGFGCRTLDAGCWVAGRCIPGLPVLVAGTDGAKFELEPASISITRLAVLGRHGGGAAHTVRAPSGHCDPSGMWQAAGRRGRLEALTWVHQDMAFREAAYALCSVWIANGHDPVSRCCFFSQSPNATKRSEVPSDVRVINDGCHHVPDEAGIQTAPVEDSSSRLLVGLNTGKHLPSS